MKPKTPAYIKKATDNYKKRKEADGCKRITISFWTKKTDEKEWKTKIWDYIKLLRTKGV